MADLRKQFRTLLVFLASVHALHGQKLWKCSGPQSKYSYLDCERDHSYSDGCYYVEHFSHFRPCAWICNDIDFNSINEKRCSAFCSGYLANNCELVDQTPQQAMTVMATMRNSSKATTTEPTTTSLPPKQKNMSGVVISVLVVAIVVVVAFGAIMVVKFCRKRRNAATAHDGIGEAGVLYQPSVTNQTLSDTKGWLNTEQTDNQLNTKLTDNVGYEESFSTAKCQDPSLHGVD